MLQRGHHAADLRHTRRLDLGVDDARLLACVGQHLAPGVDNQRMTIGLTIALVITAHRRCKNISGILDGTRLEQRVPVGLAGLPPEGRGY